MIANCFLYFESFITSSSFSPLRYSPSVRAPWHYHSGCLRPVSRWLSRSADALFVVGLCVIGFLKLTFLGLLRFEIKEMIQKIKVIRRDDVNMWENMLHIFFSLFNSRCCRARTSAW